MRRFRGINLLKVMSATAEFKGRRNRRQRHLGTSPLGPPITPRIAQLANFVGPTSGGMKVAINELGRGYADSGAERLLIIPGEENRTYHDGVGTVVEVKSPQVVGGYRIIVDTRSVLAALDQFAPTSIELSDKWTLLPVTSWARKRQIPTWLFSHERLDAMLPSRLNVERGLTTPISLYNEFVARRMAGVIVTSRFAQDEFSSLACAPTVYRVPLGVDLETFSPRVGPRRPGPLRLVHFGRMSREKHPQLAIATAVEMHRRGHDVRLDVYGTGPHVAQMKDVAGSAPVFFHGHISDRAQLARAIADADISLSVSPYETFGLAVLEALACGTPVVTADRGGASELITSLCGASGRPNPQSLADAVERLAQMPEPERRAQARAHAEHFSWARSVEAMLAIHAPGWEASSRLAS